MSTYSWFSKLPIGTSGIFTSKELDNFSGCSWLRSKINTEGFYEDEFRIITKQKCSLDREAITTAYAVAYKLAGHTAAYKEAQIYSKFGGKIGIGYCAMIAEGLAH